MDWTYVIYLAMAALFLYSLVGLRGHGLLALRAASRDLEYQAAQLQDRDTAKRVRDEILSKSHDELVAEPTISFRKKALREAMEHYCSDVKRMSLTRDAKYRRDIEDYIHMDLLEYLGNCSFVEHVCTALTGLGILGTFLGMTNGLVGFDTENAAKALESIAILTDGMQFAFATSIVGIVLSLLLGTIHKGIRHSAERNLNHFLDVFRDQVLCDQHEAGYNQLLRQLKDIELGLQGRVENEAQQLSYVAEHFINSIRDELQLDINAMRKSMEQINNQQQVFAAAVQDFGQQVSAMSNEIREINNGFGQVVVQSEKLTKNLEQAGTFIGSGVERLLQMVEADSILLENNRQLSEQLREHSNELADLVGNVNTQSLNTADVVRRLADYTASAVDETAAGCNKLVELHYAQLKDRMIALMNATEAQAAQVRDESIAQLEQIRQESSRIQEEICHEGAQILGAFRQENQRIMDEVRVNGKDAIRSVHDTAQRVVLEMPQTQILRTELESIIESQYAIADSLKRRNSLVAKLLQSLRRDAQ